MEEKLKRRAFIVKGVETGIALVAGRELTWAGTARRPIKEARRRFPDIAVVRGEDYQATTRKAMELIGGISRFVSKNTRVAILPNTQSAHPGTFTKPDIVRSVVRMCKIAGASEVNCLTWLPEKFWLATGLAKALKEEGANLKIIDSKSESQFIRVPLLKGQALREAMVMKELFNNDILINIPIAKDHAGNRYTGAMKNVMALNFGQLNRTFHSGYFKSLPDDINRLDQCIADLNLAIKPAICIVDATELITSNGPFGPGEILSPHKVVVGTDRVAIDSYCASLLGLKAEDILMIKKGYEHGLGEVDIRKILIKESSI